MHKHFHLQHTPYFYVILLISFLWLGTQLAWATSLRIEPTAPIIAVGESIPLTAVGAKGQVQWKLPKPESGEIQVISNNRAIYTAPNQVGQYYIRISDMNGANKPISTSIRVTVLPEEAARDAFSRENSVWEVFTSRSHITAMTFSESEDEKVLWVATTEGLEQRDASTGQLQQVFTNYTEPLIPHELPHYLISAVANDNQGGLWVGTYYGGLIHINDSGEWKLFDTDNSNLPNNTINTLVSDGEGGVWIAMGLPVREEFLKVGEDVVQKGKEGIPTTSLPIGDINIIDIIFSGEENPFGSIEPEKVFKNGFSELICAFAERSESIDDNSVTNGGSLSSIIGSLLPLFGTNPLFSIIGDDSLIGADPLFSNDSLGFISGLADSELDINSIALSSLRSTKSNSLEAFLGRFGNDNTQIDPQTAIDLIFLFLGEDNWLTQLFEMNSQGNLAHLSGREGKVQVYNTKNSSLPVNFISDIISDGNGGFWIGSYCGLTHYTRNGEWTNKVQELSDQHINTLSRDGNNGLWIGMSLNELAYLNNAGTLTTFDTQNFLEDDSIINDIVSDSSNSLWLATNNVGLVHLDNGESTIYNTADIENGNPNLPSNAISTIMNDGKGGLWVGTEDGGLANLDRHQSRLVDPKHFNSSSEIEPHLLDIFVNDIVYDNKEGIWLAMSSAMSQGGVAHFNNKNNQWSFFNSTNSELPSNEVYALAIDNKDGVWIGTRKIPTHEGGLAYRNNKGEWSIFNKSNSDLPSDSIDTIEYDGNNGLWISTKENDIFGDKSSIVHYDFLEKKWRIYNPTQSDLPNAHHLTVHALNYFISSLLNDGNGGVWVGASRGLAHLHNDDTWTVYEPDEIEELPAAVIGHLVSDSHGGVWVGLDGNSVFKNDKLLHLNQNGQWKSYTTNNSVLPANTITALAPDDSGGVWVGTSEGLVHINYRGEETLFNTANSGLPNNLIRALASDGKNGLWVENWGLSHLTFSQKPLLCEKVPDITEEQCATILEGNRAAIVIHPNGKGSGYLQDISVDNMATYAYQTLFLRGYDHNEVYYLAYKPNLDFNGDGVPDEIVDAPVTLQDFKRDEKNSRESLTIEHLETAFEWAKGRHDDKAEGVSEEPLVVIFVDHGLPGQLVLDSFNILDELKFKELLDDYQTATANQVVVIIEACHSGTLVDALQAPNRLIVTSTDENLAYYKDSGRTSFTRFYFDDLHRGSDYENSWTFVKDDIFTELGTPFNQLNPQWEDSAEGKMAQTLCLNDCYGKLSEPKLKPEPPRFVSKDSTELAVTIEDNENQILNVSVSVITPQTANQYNEQGFELSPSLVIENLTETEDGRWVTYFSDFTEAGEYNFLFRAKYKIRSGSRTVSALQPVTVFWCQSHAHYNVDTTTLHLPAVKMPNANNEETLYQADFALINVEPITLELNMESMVPIDNSNSACLAHFDSSTNSLSIPAVDIPNGIGGVDTFTAELQRVSEVLPWQFTLESIGLQ